MKTRNIQLEQFKARLFARICFIFIFLTQMAQRIYLNVVKSSNRPDLRRIYVATIPCSAMLIFIIIIEFLAYKKLKSKVLKYTNLLNWMFFLVFTAEWLVSLYGGLTSFYHTPFPYYTLTAPIFFTSFAWRTQLQNFIFQRWYFKIICPTCAYIMSLVVLARDDLAEISDTLFRGLLQISYLIVIFYFEEKVSFRLLLTSVHQENWIEVNEFVLDSISEKIAIFQVGGDMKYCSEYLKRFTKRFGRKNDIDIPLSNITTVHPLIQTESFLNHFDVSLLI